jgi:lipopolysaccharide transport system ATP-binding protein
VASLLEVGTGFHPELTGRENIYLNGAILGMRKKEIDRKLEEIIDFSGVERYIDTPVKRYSSGMYVRLAFAVAAHLESEILIVDEVLAVGDAEFQKKCLGKMGEVSKGEGRTVLFVSHNMGAIKSLCNKGILLENGSLVCTSNIEDTVSKYFSKIKTKYLFEYNIDSNKTAIKKIRLYSTESEKNSFSSAEEILIEVEVNIKNEKVVLAINLFDDDFNLICFEEYLANQSGKYLVKIPNNFLLKGNYISNIHLYNPNIEFYDSKIDEILIEINDLPLKYAMYDNANCGLIYSNIKINKI